MIYLKYFVIFLFIFGTFVSTQDSTTSCRDRSNIFRLDGGMCFEILPWQHQPVQLESHLLRVRDKWQFSNVTYHSEPTRKQATIPRLGLSNGEISRYMDTVIAPFLDTYHRNIQNSYQQLTSKILKKVKEEVNAAVKRKIQIYDDLMKLADKLELPPICDEERRSVRTIASNHVAQIFNCAEEAKTSIAKMGKYAEEMISLTRSHMQQTIGDVSKAYHLNDVPGVVTLKKQEIEECLESLSKAAVSLGYELDLSLTNARRHNEQSCEKLTSCSTKARKRTEELVADVKDLMYQCVYT